MNSKPRWDNPSERLLGVFLGQPPPSRVKAWIITSLLVVAIGISDYTAGIDISLAIFYLVPISLATGWLGAMPGIVVAAVCTAARVGGDLFILYPQKLPLRTWWNAPATFAVFAFVVWLLHSLIALHRHLEGKVAMRTTELMESMADRERLQHDLLEVGARERSAIGRELHDELGQHLVATAMAAKVLARRLEAKAATDATAIVRWIEEAISKSRKLARGLLLSNIPPERFPQELEELAAVSSQSGVQCRLVHQGLPLDANPAECAQLFRIAQEAVANSLRHAGARTVSITLASDDHALCLIVEDDGRGVTVTQDSGSAGMGLRIMEHRARLIGASFSILSKPGEGTKVVCRLPRREPAAA